MTDIVKRLNAPPVANHYYSPGQPLEGPVLTERREAAAEIERLRDLVNNQMNAANHVIERLRAENEAGLRNTLAMQNAANVLRIRAEKAEAEIERLQAALVRIQNWYPISVANPRWTIKEIQEFAHAAREGKDE